MHWDKRWPGTGMVPEACEGGARGGGVPAALLEAMLE